MMEGQPTRPSRPLVFKFFVMNTPSHITHGTWRMPGSGGVQYKDLDFWVDLAKRAEEAKVDGMFFADVLGLGETQNGDWSTIAQAPVQFPAHDPSALISAMAYNTKHLGFVYTSNTTQSHPFTFARSISTLDHLTKGRVGWNVVTGASSNGARNTGLKAIMDHAERYGMSDEYLDVAYKLWEGSWEDDALVEDKDKGVFANPEKIHKIYHQGEKFSVEGPHLVTPSPQRVPVLFQAGASGPGITFAAKHAEGAFIVSGAPDKSAAKIAALKSELAKAGRREDEMHFIEGVGIIVGKTDEEAAQKEAEMLRYISKAGSAQMASGLGGLDLTKYAPETLLEELIAIAPGAKGSFEAVINSINGRKATVLDMQRWTAHRVVGSPESVADRIQEFADAGVTGINIIALVNPGTFHDFVDLLAPELKRRGLMQTEYRPGTFREKLFPGNACGHKPNERHPASVYRGHGPFEEGSK